MATTITKTDFQNQRVWDLIRSQRIELHTQGLITDDEYVALAQDHPAVERLERYDALRTFDLEGFCKRLGDTVNEISQVAEALWSTNQIRARQLQYAVNTMKHQLEVALMRVKS